MRVPSGQPSTEENWQQMANFLFYLNSKNVMPALCFKIQLTQLSPVQSHCTVWDCKTVIQVCKRNIQSAVYFSTWSWSASGKAINSCDCIILHTVAKQSGISCFNFWAYGTSRSKCKLPGFLQGAAPCTSMSIGNSSALNDGRRAPSCWDTRIWAMVMCTQATSILVKKMGKPHVLRMLQHTSLNCSSCCGWDLMKWIKNWTRTIEAAMTDRKS